jgi:NADH dehydrogenase FAD-containing subunit
MNDHGEAVILGAGFGGLETTKTLRRAPVEISHL